MLKINEYFYRLQGKDSFVQKNHRHNEIEFIQVINGSGIVVKNDKTYLLQSQHLYVIDARNTHIVYPQPDDCADYIRNKIVIDADSFIEFFTLSGMQKILNDLFDGNPVSTADDPEIDKIYKTVHDLCNLKTEESLTFAQGYVIQLIHHIYMNSRPETKYENTDTFQKILNIINEKEGITSLNEISKLLYMDKHYLCHLFRRKAGTTLSSYLSDKVFEKCCRMIESTSYSMEKIAYLCGFSSSASLTRFFKNKCGKTPSEHRRERISTLRLKI